MSAGLPGTVAPAHLHTLAAEIGTPRSVAKIAGCVGPKTIAPERLAHQHDVFQELREAPCDPLQIPFVRFFVGNRVDRRAIAFSQVE